MEDKFTFSGVANTGIYRAQDGTVRGMWDGLEITIEEFVIRVAEARAAAARAHAAELQKDGLEKDRNFWRLEWAKLQSEVDRKDLLISAFKEKGGQACNWLHALANPHFDRVEEIRQLADDLCSLVKGKSIEKRVDPVQKSGHCHGVRCTVDLCCCICDRCLR